MGGYVMSQGGNTDNNGSLRDIWIGIGATFLIYIASFFVLLPLLNIFGLFIGLAGHIVAIVLSFQKGRKRLGQGLLIGLGLTILLVAACFGIVIYSLG